MNFYLVYILVYLVYCVHGEDEGSGSGYDEDPMKIAKSQNSKNKGADLSQSVQSAKNSKSQASKAKDSKKKNSNSIATAFNDFAKELAVPLTAGALTPQGKQGKNPKGNNKSSPVVISLTAPASKAKNGKVGKQVAGTDGDISQLHDQNDDEDDDDDEEDELSGKPSNATKESKTVTMPLQKNPKGIKDNSGTPNPVSNTQGSPLLKPITPDDAGDDDDSPKPPTGNQPSVGISETSGEKPPPTLNIATPLVFPPPLGNAVDNGPLPPPPPQQPPPSPSLDGLIASGPSTPPPPSPDTLNDSPPIPIEQKPAVLPPPAPPAPEASIFEEIDGNTNELSIVNSRMNELESRLTDLEDTVSDLEDEVKRVEKKVDRPLKVATDSFNKFVGPPETVQGDITLDKPPPLDVFSEPKPTSSFNQPPPKENSKPKVLKEFFVPLPPPNSPAAKAINAGEPIGGLPFPLNEIVSDIFRKMGKGAQQEDMKPMTITGPLPAEPPKPRPQPLPDVAFPPREHDIDRLELELGKPTTQRKKPKIIIISKSPQFLDLMDKNCDEPCENGGQCLGNNVCKCPPMFSGVKCEKFTQPPNLPEGLLEMLTPDAENEPLKKSGSISVPILFSDPKDDSGDDDSKPVGEVEQNKVVDYLSRLMKNVPVIPEIVKRGRILHFPIKRNEIPRPYTYQLRGYTPRSETEDLTPRSNIYTRYFEPNFQLRRYNHPNSRLQRRTLTNRYQTTHNAPRTNVFHYRNIERNAIPRRYTVENNSIRIPRDKIYYQTQKK